jgi:hypothetical protein
MEWFVPSSELRLAWRDLGLRIGTWPVCSALARRRLALDPRAVEREIRDSNEPQGY